jgi:hypothetical protein
MDARRFPTEPWNGESENPRNNEPFGLPFSGKRFSLVTFFGKTKKVTRRQAEALLLICLPARKSRASAWRRVTFLCWPKEKSPKEMASSTRQTPPVTSTGIFRLGILPRSENGAHPCAPPYGSGEIAVVCHRKRTPIAKAC